MVSLEDLNEEQKQAVCSEDSRIVCIAGPGTGKTHVLTKRIEFLVGKGIVPEKILAITFTRKARREMQRRLEKRGIENVQVHTFNSFCEGFLRKHEQKIYGGGVRVQGYADRIFALNMVGFILGENIDGLLEEYYSEQQKKRKTKEQLFNNFLDECFSVIEHFKLSQKDFYDFRNRFEGEDYRKADIVYRVVDGLLKYLEMQGLRDYTDQILDSIRAFEKYPEIVPEFEHILVDEYQDVNSLQVRLLQLLSPKNLFVVGDPRQSIFSWRGSDLRFFVDFEKYFGDAKRIELIKNYRSGKEVLDFINRVALPFELRELEAVSEGGQVEIKNFENEEEELKEISELINFKDPDERVLVLARTNKQLVALSKLLNVPHFIKQDIEDFEGEVTLATVHAAKGTEADFVIVLGAGERYFPCKSNGGFVLEKINGNNYDRVAEERRLFYVAVSRAKKKLLISYSGKITRFLEGMDFVRKN